MSRQLTYTSTRSVAPPLAPATPARADTTYPRYRCSCNLVHWLPLFSFRLIVASQSWCFDTVTGRWEVPSYSRGSQLRPSLVGSLRRQFCDVDERGNPPR